MFQEYLIKIRDTKEKTNSKQPKKKTHSIDRSLDVASGLTIDCVIKPITGQNYFRFNYAFNTNNH